MRSPAVSRRPDQVGTKSGHPDFRNLDLDGLDDFCAYQNVRITHETDFEGFLLFDGAPGDLGDQF